MSIKKGIERVAKTISLFGWGLFFVALFGASFKSLVKEDVGVFLQDSGYILAFLIVPQLFVWIIDGFNDSSKSSVLFLSKYLSKST